MRSRQTFWETVAPSEPPVLAAALGGVGSTWRFSGRKGLASLALSQSSHGWNADTDQQAGDIGGLE